MTMYHEVNGVYYKSSNYSSFEEAANHGAVHNWCTTYGKSATLDCLENIKNVLGCLDPSLIGELRFRFTVDGNTLPECDFDEAETFLNI